MDLSAVKDASAGMHIQFSNVLANMRVQAALASCPVVCVFELHTLGGEASMRSFLFDQVRLR